MPSIVAIVAWHWIPFATLLVLTGLQSLPHGVLEAAPLAVYVASFKTAEGLFWAKMSAASMFAVLPARALRWAVAGLFLLLLFLPLHALDPRPFPFWLHLTLVLLLVVFTFPNAQARALEGLGKVVGLAASFTGFCSTLLAALLGTLVGQASAGAPLPFSLGLLGLGALAFAAVFLAEASPLCGSPPPGGPGGSPPG